MLRAVLSSNRNNILTTDYSFSQVTDFSEFVDFDCGNPDLNDFILNDARQHKQERLAETYSFRLVDGERETLPVAFASLLNDSIKLKPSLVEQIPEHLRYHDLPAVKIGRLGVRKEVRRNKIGTTLINVIKELLTTHNRTGCRFLTVDAYNNTDTIPFYRANGFDFYHNKDANRKTRIMFFDLMTFVSVRD